MFVSLSLATVTLAVLSTSVGAIPNDLAARRVRTVTVTVTVAPSSSSAKATSSSSILSSVSSVSSLASSSVKPSTSAKSSTVKTKTSSVSSAKSSPSSVPNPTCPSGQFYSTVAPVGCQACPLGNSCSGTGNPVPCPRGYYQSYTGQNFCYGAPSGRFTNVTGSVGVCAVCCGWYTTQGGNPNFNTGDTIFKCPANAPNAAVGSGDGASGCSTQGRGCTPVATCTQAADGTCPTTAYFG
ncbi:hypothetical protein DFH07DRAFT_1004961 [Mycena maculata]|uniref:Uncharacterized protein n=1 Tax=Mycena maculata TaxID=230809 RepID=A0AAD7MM77_9AGAR|nr:hypothetical protein DFH07DRAFT_1004961 [Mycena maculata]